MKVLRCPDCNGDLISEGLGWRCVGFCGRKWRADELIILCGNDEEKNEQNAVKGENSQAD